MASAHEMKEKLVLASGQEEQKIDEMIESKKKEFPGVSVEGTITLVARELGINLLAPFKKEIKIGNIVPNMRNITFIGKVTDVSPIREFNKDGRSGRVKNLTVEDETGKIRVTLWNDEIDKYNFLLGDTVKVDNCSTRSNNFGSAEARVSFGSITKTDAEIMVKEPKTSLSGIEENDEVAIDATLLHVFERPMIYYFCPQCRSRVSDGACAMHGPVDANKTLIVSGLLDDGSSTINAVFFNSVGEKLFNASVNEIEHKLSEQSISEFIISKDCLTKKFKILGTARRNQMTNELELRVKRVE